MGTANKVPGVSGGAVAFVLGFYEELIYTFQKINGKALKLLVNGRFKSLAAYLNLSFLFWVMGGSLFSYFSLSVVLDYFLQTYELYVWSLFFGMIIGSVYYIGKRFAAWTYQNTVVALLGLCIGLALSFLPPAKENSNLWFVFLCGIIGVSGMTFPGLSGSFLLILLGNYVLLLVDSVNVIFDVTANLLSGKFEVLQDPENRRYIKIALTFFLGSFVGLVAISHLLTYVMKRWNHLVTALIIGFITGSLGMVWPWKKKVFVLRDGRVLTDSQNNPVLEGYQRFLPDFELSTTWFSLLCIGLGSILVVGIDFFEHKKKTKKNER